MPDATRSQLEQAYKLIQQENLDGAIAILRPIVESQPNNADAWWLLANAVSEPKEAYEALNNVIRLKPKHAEARDLLNKLTEQFPALASAEPTGFGTSGPTFDDLFGSTPSSAPAPSESGSFSSDDLDSLLGPASQPQGKGSTFGSSPAGEDFFGADDPFATTGPMFAQDDALIEGGKGGKPAKPAKAPKPQREERPKPVRLAPEAPPADPFELERRANSRPHPFMIATFVLIIAVLVGAGVAGAYFLGVFGKGGPATPPPPSAAMLNAFSQISDQLKGNGYQVFAVTSINNPSFGPTLTTQVCGIAAPEIADRVDKAMDIIAQQAVTVQSEIKAASIQVVNCTNAKVILFRATAPIQAIIDYVNGKMSDPQTFRAKWIKG